MIKSYKFKILTFAHLYEEIQKTDPTYENSTSLKGISSVQNAQYINILV